MRIGLSLWRKRAWISLLSIHPAFSTNVDAMQSPITPRRRTVYSPSVSENWKSSEKAEERVGFLKLSSQDEDDLTDDEDNYLSQDNLTLEDNYLSGIKLVVLMFALGLSVFLVALDNTIIDTAVVSAEQAENIFLLTYFFL